MRIPQSSGEVQQQDSVSSGTIVPVDRSKVDVYVDGAVDLPLLHRPLQESEGEGEQGHIHQERHS